MTVAMKFIALWQYSQKLVLWPTSHVACVFSVKQGGSAGEKEWDTRSTATLRLRACCLLAWDSRSQTGRSIKGQTKWNRGTESTADALRVAIHSEVGCEVEKRKYIPVLWQNVPEPWWQALSCFLGPYEAEGVLSAREDTESGTWGSSFAILLSNHSPGDQQHRLHPHPSSAPASS